MPPEVLLLHRIVLAILDFFFAFPNEVEYCSFEVLEEFCWDFAGHCIESVDCFWLNFCFLSFMFERHFYRNENAKH